MQCDCYRLLACNTMPQIQRSFVGGFCVTEVGTQSQRKLLDIAYRAVGALDLIYTSHPLSGICYLSSGMDEVNLPFYCQNHWLP